jgi:hypothetical protein
MSKLLAVLLLISSSAMADIIATSTNKGGGKLVLTSERCSSDKGFIAYSQIKDKPTLPGCWNYDTEFVHILWRGDDLWSYPIQNWNFVEKPLKPNT